MPDRPISKWALEEAKKALGPHSLELDPVARALDAAVAKGRAAAVAGLLRQRLNDGNDEDAVRYMDEAIANAIAEPLGSPWMDVAQRLIREGP